MLPNFIIRALTLAFGYIYPGYKCFKALQRRRPDVKELIFWCRFWVLLAVMTTTEFFADPLLSWIPMYPEAKLALVVFLWHPNTLGSDYIYDRFLLPLLARHESVIDRHLKDIQEQVQQIASHLWHQACTYAQVQFMELVSYLSAMSTEAARQASSLQYLERNGRWDRPQVRELEGDDDSAEYTFVNSEDNFSRREIPEETEHEGDFTDQGAPLQDTLFSEQPQLPNSSLAASGVASNAKQELNNIESPLARLRPRKKSAGAIASRQ